MTTKRTVLITGANRGIGLEFTKKYLSEGDKVFATYRSDKAALLDLKEIYPDQLTLLEMDVAEKKSIQDAFKPIQVLADSIDILINNAGRGGTGQASVFEDFDIEDMVLTYRTNTLGPLLVTQCALPLIEKSAIKKVIHISSRVGSIEDNERGRSYGYRASKTALNMINKNLSLELKDKGISTICIHPGWVKTDMTGGNAQITPEESVSKICQTIDQCSFKDTGGFFRLTGETIPW